MAERIIIQSSQRFGKLVAMSDAGLIKGARMWLCQCDCGNQKLIHKSALYSGLTISCGCNKKEQGRKRVIDITGQKFARLTALSATGDSTNDGKAFWNCICDCGRTAIVTGKQLRNGHTKSCGCWKIEATGNRARTHGQSKTPEYKAWKHAKERCFNPNTKDYANWGGRGITMCDQWRNSFEAFISHIGPRPHGTTLDRFPDNDGHYAPGNVRWATRKQQCETRRDRWRNHHRSN